MRKLNFKVEEFDNTIFDNKTMANETFSKFENLFYTIITVFI